MHTNVLIIGSGIGGLSLAIELSKLNPEVKITILTKEDAFESNTRYAQGGIAAVMTSTEDSFEAHVTDTLSSGKGLCDREVVQMVVEQAPDRINDLLKLGVRFDRDEKNNLQYALEGGHSKPRIVHYKDITGFEIEAALLRKINTLGNVRLLSNTITSDIEVETTGHETRCTGAYVYNESLNTLTKLMADVTVLATGGCGQVFLNTTNPQVATGDGYAMCYRAGVRLKNMRFMQFHPTSLYTQAQSSVSFLISEAVRGFGAHIVDGRGKRFLFAYDTRGELATRDVITSAIMRHLESGDDDHIYLDLRHLSAKKCEKRFPGIVSELKKHNLSIQHHLIPVVPSAHYQCGGVHVNKQAQTNIPNLYAVGEVACTGLHGANRLASNSLLEALVFSYNAARSIAISLACPQKYSNLLSSKTEKVERHVNNNYVSNHVTNLKKIMSSAFFSSEENSISKALEYIALISNKAEEEIRSKCYSGKLLLLRNLFQTAHLILSDKLEMQMKHGIRENMLQKK